MHSTDCCPLPCPGIQGQKWGLAWYLGVHRYTFPIVGDAFSSAKHSANMETKRTPASELSDRERRETQNTSTKTKLGRPNEQLPPRFTRSRSYQRHQNGNEKNNERKSISLDELVSPAATPAAGRRRHRDARRGGPKRAPDLLRRPAQERQLCPVRHHLVQRRPEIKGSGNASLDRHHQQNDLAARGAVWDRRGAERGTGE